MAKTYAYDTFKHVDILQKEVTYFLSLAEHLNISKCSELLGIQQSGLSRALQRLEHDFGQKLFQRKNNGLVLTSAGEQIYQAVKSTKLLWELNFKKVISDSDTPTGLIKIGFHPSVGQKFFSQIVLTIQTQFPEVELEIHTQASAQITRMVNDQDLDFGLVISHIKQPELIQKKIGTDYLAAYQAKDVEKPEHILVNPEMRSSLAIIKKYNHLKKVAIKDYDLMAQTCSKGSYIAILPQSSAEKYPNLKQVSGALLRADISCIVHKERLASVAHKKLFECLVSTCLKA
jgi:DNA-binding transcriptional LysR family regulator